MGRGAWRAKSCTQLSNWTTVWPHCVYLTSSQLRFQRITQCPTLPHFWHTWLVPCSSSLPGLMFLWAFDGSILCLMPSLSSYPINVPFKKHRSGVRQCSNGNVTAGGRRTLTVPGDEGWLQQAECMPLLHCPPVLRSQSWDQLLQEAFLIAPVQIAAPLPQSTTTVCLPSAFLVSLSGMVDYFTCVCLVDQIDCLHPKNRKLVSR